MWTSKWKLGVESRSNRTKVGEQEAPKGAEGREKHVCLPVLRPPTFHKAHSDGAHPGELVNGLKALIDRLGQQRRKLLVVENLQITA